MKSRAVLFLGVASLACLAGVLAWTKEDHEIFDLVSALEKSEGKGTSFYSFLGIDPAAGLDAINKAYRKRSLTLHPDKNPNVKDIQARFARLGVITNILRDAARRERYDFFFKNGVPVWRGTGYYYSRFRPSVVHVILFLILLSTAVHWLILQLNYQKDKRRIDYFTRSAKTSGSGVLSGTQTPTESSNQAPENIADVVDQLNTNGDARSSTPEPRNRRERRSRKANKDASLQASATASGTATPIEQPTIRRRKVRVPMVEGNSQSPSLDLLVVGDEVFIPEEEGVLTPISSLARKPNASALWPMKIALTGVRAVKAAFGIEETDVEAAEGAEEFEATNGQESNGSGTKKKRVPGNAKLAAMRRRKATLAK